MARQRLDRQAAKHRDAASAENETARRKREAVGDARAEFLRSAPAESVQPTPPASELKMVDAASVVATAGAALAPPALVANGGTDQLAPDHPTPRQVDVETLLQAAPAASDPVAASVPPAPPIAEARDDAQGWAASWLGVLLMALGLVSVLSSSRVLRRAPRLPSLE